MKNARWAWAGNGPPLARICNTAAYLLLSFEASCSKKADFGRNYQKPHHRHGDGYPPWVKIVHTATGLASHAECLLQAARGGYTPPAGIPFISTAWQRTTRACLSGAQAAEIYQTWMRRWHIAQRFLQPDWSIVDLWVARALLARGMSPADVSQILQLGSPGFPRGHSDPADYLRRTLARAFPVFPAPGRAVCAAPAPASAAGVCPQVQGQAELNGQTQLPITSRA